MPLNKLTLSVIQKCEMENSDNNNNNKYLYREFVMLEKHKCIGLQVTSCVTKNVKSKHVGEYFGQ